MAETCGDHHVFPADPLARTRRAEVWCTKPPHPVAEAHEAIKGTTAYCWRNKCGAPMTSGPGAGIPSNCDRYKPCAVHDSRVLDEVRA